MAQTTNSPVYSDQRIPRPAGLRQIQTDDFQPDLKRIDHYPEGIIYEDKQTLLKLGNYLVNQPEGKELWAKECEYVTRVLNEWDFVREGFSANRYIYCLEQLETLSIIYLFTGHRELGSFMKAHIMQIAGLPFEFWLHAELRGYDPGFPLGQLETSVVCTGTSVAMSAAGELFSAEEREMIESALRNKGLQPCLNWLRKPKLNNYTAVIGSAAVVAAKYLKDDEGKHQAQDAISFFLNGTVEKDGSYGEGTGYFNYPIGSLLSAVLCMSEKERKSTFGSSGLKNSAVWQVYPYLFNTDKDGRLLPNVVHYGDNPYSSYPDNSVNVIFASLYQHPLSTWLMNKFNTKSGLKEMMLLFSTKSGLPDPKSPEECRLPLLSVFDSGDCFMRSTWDDNGIVLGLRSGNGSRIKFNHQRAELNSICMGAYGEYMVVSPGSFSYRHPLHYLYDWTTRAANTITINDRNQLFPGKGQSSWIRQLDNSGFWVQGTPKAEVVYSKIGKMADVLVNEASQAYSPKMKYARRSVIFVKDPGYFVIIDKMEASSDTALKFTMRLHFNNRDEQGRIENKSSNHWLFKRPLANLDIFVFSDQKLESVIGKGYMHGPKRDYSPGGENEGKEGSSIELEVFNPEKYKSLTFYSVLFPSKEGMTVPHVIFGENTVAVGSDKLMYDGTDCILLKNGKTEHFSLHK